MVTPNKPRWASIQVFVLSLCLLFGSCCRFVQSNSVVLVSGLDEEDTAPLMANMQTLLRHEQEESKWRIGYWNRDLTVCRFIDIAPIDLFEEVRIDYDGATSDFPRKLLASRPPESWSSHPRFLTISRLRKGNDVETILVDVLRNDSASLAGSAERAQLSERHRFTPVEFATITLRLEEFLSRVPATEIRTKGHQPVPGDSMDPFKE